MGKPEVVENPSLPIPEDEFDRLVRICKEKGCAVADTKDGVLFHYSRQFLMDMIAELDAAGKDRGFIVFITRRGN